MKQSALFEEACRHRRNLTEFWTDLQVPPMPASQARAVIEEELGGLPLEEVFEWIDLDEPLGSASIAQVPLPADFMHVAS